MSIKRILAAAAASVVAVSAMAAVASADALLTTTVTESSAPTGNIWEADLSAVDADILGKVETVVATITSTAFVNGGIGGNTVSAGGWAQSAEQKNEAAATNDWKWEGVGGLVAEEGTLQVQIWWQNANEDGTASTVTIDKVDLLDASGAVLYTFGSAAAPADSTPEESKTEESKTEESKTDDNTSTNANNVDTGVEGVAAVLGVAAVAAGAMIVAKKRK